MFVLSIFLTLATPLLGLLGIECCGAHLANVYNKHAKLVSNQPIGCLYTVWRNNYLTQVAIVNSVKIGHRRSKKRKHVWLSPLLLQPLSPGGAAKAISVSFKTAVFCHGGWGNQTKSAILGDLSTFLTFDTHDVRNFTYYFYVLTHYFVGIKTWNTSMWHLNIEWIRLICKQNVQLHLRGHRVSSVRFGTEQLDSIVRFWTECVYNIGLTN